MATTATFVQNADSLVLKRAFAHDLVPTTYVPYSNLGEPCPRPRQRASKSYRLRMVQTSPRTTALPMPSFMSVFGEEINRSGLKGLSERSSTGAHGNHTIRPASSGNFPNGSAPLNATFAAFHVHRDSTSTVASESSDSSPTTTISTMDSSSVTDPSPGPSPESPVAKAAATSFVSDFRSRRTENNLSDSSANTFFELQRPTTPAKKPRNLKNLGINTSSSLSNLRSNTTGALPVLANRDRNSSAPTSPSFIKPPTPPKRRPSNLSLTIQTPGSDSKPARLMIPSTPSFNRPALRHFQSSPSLPLCSPSVAPAGGMQLPPLRPIKASPPGFAEVPIEADEEDQEPNFDVPQSREEKPAAYPHGPICIYESGVYLYFEPTAEQASTYDVIINVASEVKNPFTNPLPASKKDLDARRVDGPPAENVDFAAIPDRDNASSINTEGSSPTTPKAIAALDTAQPTEHMVNGTSYKSPEYIHMLWEHNTDIVPDLYKLVKMMDERVQQGKRILIHCQCGVSRSASLIVAYGIYKNPGISVQEAYDAVKKRSKWIGPNMNLIMQLQEFRNGLLRANESRGHPSAFGFPRRSAGLPTGVSNGTHRPSPFEREPASGSRTPRTAPLPPESDMGLQRASTGNIMSVSPGPLSAPSGSLFSPGFRQSWAASQTHFDLSPKTSPTTTAIPLVDPKNFVVPVLSMPDNVGPAQKVENAPTGQVAEPLLPVDLKPLPVPNFSRQLPFRQQAETENTALSQLIAPTQSAGLDTLVSPMVSSFDIPRIPTIQTRAPQFPSAKRFDSTAWPSGYESDSQPSPRSSGPNLNELPRSPRSSEFHKTGLEHETTNDVFGLLAPRAPNLTLKQPSGSGDEVSSDFEVSSPTITEFPRERFTRTDNVLDNRMTSLRATEFHMTPLKPRVPDEDPFGLASPRKFDFPSEPFEKAELTLPRDDEAETRRPSFQAILPPASLAQPEAINGFASLNGTTQALPNTHVQTPLSTVVPPTLINPTNLGGSFSNLIERKLPLSQPPRSSAVSPESTESNVSKTPNHLLSSTSAKETKIRTRFSSPNLREQRKLHKLQTELEAMLPHKTLPPPQAVDDLDALMSPRAEEFTRNPFHFTLKSPVDDVSPASSNETITNAQPGVDWEDTQHFTPQKVAEDPRSPVLAGSSPIVRSIWDVL